MNDSKSENKNKARWYAMSFYESIVTGALVIIIGLMLQLVADNATTKALVANNTIRIDHLDIEHSKRLDEFNGTIKKFYEDFYKKPSLTALTYKLNPRENTFNFPMNAFFGPVRKEYDRRGLRLGKDFRHRTLLEGRLRAPPQAPEHDSHWL